MRRLMRVAPGDLRTVDSAEGDCLEFYIDGVRQDRISGNVDWDDQSYEITGSGTHSQLWQWAKRGSSI